MAERRIFEKEMKVHANVKNLLSVIGDFTVDKKGLRVDDTIGPMFELTFEKGTEVVQDFVILRVRVADATLNSYKTIYRRSLSEYNALAIPMFRRYRRPFVDFEMTLGFSHNIFENGEVVARDGDKVLVKTPPNTYKGNPQLDARLGDRVLVDILTPYQLVPKKCKITLQFIELFGHIGPEEIQVE